MVRPDEEWEKHKASGTATKVKIRYLVNRGNIKEGTICMAKEKEAKELIKLGHAEYIKENVKSSEKTKEAIKILNEKAGIEPEINNKSFLDSFIWDESKVIESKVFPIDTHQDFFYYGLLLPREVDKKQRNEEGKEEVVGKEQKYFPCIITSRPERKLIMITQRTKEDNAIKFDSIPNALPKRWKLKHILNYVQGNSKKINAKELLEKVSSQYEKYVYIKNKVWYKILAVWDIGTYNYMNFEAYPFIENRGIAGTGKTKTMSISSLMSFNGGQIMVNPSESTLFRETDEIRGTKYFDEAEKLWAYNKSTKQFEGDVRTELINASYTKEAKVPRQEKIGNKFVTKWYSPYSPTQLSSINGLYGATETRAITRICTKSPNNDDRGESEPSEDRNNPIWTEVRDECYRFTLENWKEIKELYNNFPKDCGLKRRDLQIWKPLLSIAKFISEEDYKDILDFAIELSEMRLDELITESSFDYMCLEALKITILNYDQTDKHYLDKIKDMYCLKKGDEESKKDIYLNRNIGQHLKRLGFEKKRDGTGTYIISNKGLYDEIVSPICPQLAFISTLSTLSTPYNINNNKKDVDSVKISVDDKKGVV